MKLMIAIYNKDNQLKTGRNDYEDFHKELINEGEQVVYIADQNFYFDEGDYIKVVLDKPSQYLFLKFDESLNESLVYVKEKEFIYQIPISENWKEALPEFAYRGKRHYISVRVAKDYEIYNYQNLALNTHDLNENNGVFPHASANVETRNDATFFARNVIDGMIANLSHGSYPYQSWGINRQDDAELKIEYGRVVEVDQINFVLRNDFPHDNYWISGELSFSNGETIEVQFEKQPGFQGFRVEPIRTEWVCFRKLVKSPLDSPFPALTEMEVFGRNLRSED